MSKLVPKPWTEEEHNILVEATNKQIEAENQSGNVMKWIPFWRDIVVPLLAKQGYVRTDGACNLFYSKIITFEAAATKAVGSAWSEIEDKILFTATDEQLELEANDRSLEIIWADWWPRMSAQLKKAGFERSKLECEVRWAQENFSSHTINTLTSRLKKQSLVKDGLDFETSDEDEDESMVAAAQQSSAKSQWTETQDSQLRSHRLAALTRHGNSRAEEVPEAWLWETVANALQRGGHSKTVEECKQRWLEQENGREVSSEFPESMPAPEVSSNSPSSTITFPVAAMSQINSNIYKSAADIPNRSSLIKLKIKSSLLTDILAKPPSPWAFTTSAQRERFAILLSRALTDKSWKQKLIAHPTSRIFPMNLMSLMSRISNLFQSKNEDVQDAPIGSTSLNGQY